MVALLLALLGMGLVVQGQSSSGDGRDAAHAGYVNIEVQSSIDPRDKKAHKEFASDVFAATVERKVGEKPRLTILPPDAPEDAEPQEIAYEQFEVKLTENVKGGLKAGDKVVVEQAGGQNITGQVELYEETPRLREGEEYLLLVRYDKDRRTYGIVSQSAGIVPLEEDKAKKIKEYEGL